MAPTLEIPDADLVPSYTAEEERQLTLNVLELTELVSVGGYLDRCFDTELMCEFHRHLFRGVRDHGGKHRQRGWGSERLTYGPHRSAAREEVPAELRSLFAEAARMLRSLDENQEDGKYESSAFHIAVFLHARLVRIHPFEDGNGRTARLLMNAFLVRVGLRPVPAEFPRREYFDAMDHWLTTNDLQPVIDLFLRVYPD